ncbi:MAG: glycogen/starch synthase [Chlamydiia bacterium]|nr:glycogen/starch synthase [Chlamydiia bacterium]
MRIVHLTTELAPLAKVGGLGDVTTGLAKGLLAEEEEVTVFLPFYDRIEKEKLSGLKRIEESPIWEATFEGIPLRLVEDSLFKRGVIYGEEDDLLRFTTFVSLAMEAFHRWKERIDILHLHDWLTAFAAPLYHEKYRGMGLEIGGIVTTIHNMKYQGVCSPEKLAPFGVKGELFADPGDPKKCNLLKGALLLSDALTTVSPTYAKEIEGDEGFGLGEIITKRQEAMKGILNGIETDYWNPASDSFLKKRYAIEGESLSEVREAKKENRKALYKALNMDYDPAPLFTAITRIVEQKGPEMIRFGIEYVLKKGGQFILLGSTPEPKLKEEFHALAESYRDNPHVHFHFIFDEPLAHLTFAASDLILIPSLFEPCGLTQMIALRYGTIPIVHKVGGLSDTVFDIDHEEIPLEKRNGYTFDYPSNDSLSWSIDRAFEHLKNGPHKWELMMKNGMEKDWSWKTPTLEYLELYRENKSSHLYRS